ncbi:MAG: alpha-N-arabinofuranosidase [Planctomycetota bacterium]|nr:alpha-N-arabinofuranosidase [Planctomycetota bacterium]
MPSNLFRHKPSNDAARASVRVDLAARGACPVEPFLLGKFCEHLGSNIYNGMEAQILRNPTFARWRFGAGDNSVDGGVLWEHDQEQIAARVKAQAERYGSPDPAPLLEAWSDGGAFGWLRRGAREDVRLSPDAGPHGGRAQRVELLKASAQAPAGLRQLAHLPLHRTRGFEFRVVARALEPAEAELSIAKPGGETLAKAALRLDRAWSTLHGRLELPEGLPPDERYEVSIACARPANLVLGRVLLYPDDHVRHADPDVIRFLKEAKLPILRWPGGNFVSAYRWRDGIGPVDARPTNPNPAWEGLEYNLFGTAEFIGFCRAVGCEPMICVNGGDGTPEEAAAWIEYCNGSADTPLGRLRAEHGHPEPFGVRYWEAGNELYGRWQVGWTTGPGYLDRYLRFREAMLRADPAIRLIANGDAMQMDNEWNRLLVEVAGGDDLCIADHILTGGGVDAETDPAELYGAFLGFAPALCDSYRRLRERMRQAGLRRGRVAITELQLFARFRGEEKPGGKMTRATLPSQDSITEALYFATLLHECARLDGFVEMITHSATVNHGGGLRKQRERVWGNPVHYAHVLGHALVGGTPVGVEVACGTYATSHTYGHIPPLKDIPVLDAFAVEKDGALVVNVIHRGAASGALDLELSFEGLTPKTATAVQLAGETWHDRNTREEPTRIVPRPVDVTVGSGGRAVLRVPPFSLTVLKFGK